MGDAFDWTTVSAEAVATDSAEIAESIFPPSRIGNADPAPAWAGVTEAICPTALSLGRLSAVGAEEVAASTVESALIETGDGESVAGLEGDAGVGVRLGVGGDAGEGVADVVVEDIGAVAVVEGESPAALEVAGDDGVGIGSSIGTESGTNVCGRGSMQTPWPLSAEGTGGARLTEASEGAWAGEYTGTVPGARTATCAGFAGRVSGIAAAGVEGDGVFAADTRLELREEARLAGGSESVGVARMGVAGGFEDKTTVVSESSFGTGVAAPPSTGERLGSESEMMSRARAGCPADGEISERGISFALVIGVGEEDEPDALNDGAASVGDAVLSEAIAWVRTDGEAVCGITFVRGTLPTALVGREADARAASVGCRFVEIGTAGESASSREAGSAGEATATPSRLGRSGVNAEEEPAALGVTGSLLMESPPVAATPSAFASIGRSVDAIGADRGGDPELAEAAGVEMGSRNDSEA